VGVVILPNDKTLLSGALSGARDSKQMTPRQREALALRIKEVALEWEVGFAEAHEVDMQGIVRATRLAAIRALHQFTIDPQYLLTDFRLELPQLDIPQRSFVKGDARCLSIACASILAKTERDALMRELDSQHPGYGLAKHKGYGTQAHRSAMKRLGLSSIHRRSFKVKS
jgi:ribonuclease HII